MRARRRMALNRRSVQRRPARRSAAAVVAEESGTGGRRRAPERRRRPSSPRPTPRQTVSRAPTARRHLRSAHRAHHARQGRKASRDSHANGNRARPQLRLRPKPRRTVRYPKPRQLWLRTPTQRWPRPTANRQRRDVVAAEAAAAEERNPRANPLPMERNRRQRVSWRPRPNRRRSNRKRRQQAARHDWPRAHCARRNNSNADGVREGSSPKRTRARFAERRRRCSSTSTTTARRSPFSRPVC